MCAACVGLNWTDEVGKLQKRACSALAQYGGKYKYAWKRFSPKRRCEILQVDVRLFLI